MPNALIHPYRLAALAVMTATAAACSSMSAQEAVAPPKQETVAAPTTVRGIYVYSYRESAQTLHLCDNGPTLLLTGPDDVLEPLFTRSLMRSRGPDRQRGTTGIYVEVTGHMEPAPSSAYANTLVASEAAHLDDYLPDNCMPAPAPPKP